MFTSRQPRGFSLIVMTFALVLSTVQNISAANATTLTCAQGGECVVGNTGPGGGKVFYVDSTGNGFDCGPTMGAKCMYLEYSRSLAVGGLPWSISSLNTTAIGVSARGALIGSGYKNTLAIIAQQGAYDAVANKYEAGAAQSFRGGGKTDWYQPSKDELTELYGSLAAGERNLGFANASTEIDASRIWGIWTSGAGSVITSGINKSDPNVTIPIRAFTLAVDGNYICAGGSFDVFQGEVLSPTSCTGEVTIPEGVWSINTNAFLDSAITRISFPTTLRRIGGSAFQGANLLETITIPDGVTNLGTNAFKDATSVTSVSIGTGLTMLNSYSFANLTSLVNLTIPSSVRTIGSNAFAGATHLQTLAISNGVTTILPNAFNGAHLLSSLIIPSSVTALRDGSFGDTPALLSVRILSTSMVGPYEDPVFYGTSSLACLINQSNLTLLQLGLPDVPSCSSVPEAPVISTLTGGDRQLRIAFTIASDGGETIDQIQYSTDGGANWVNASGTTSPINIISLSARTSYTIKIRVHNSLGNSLGSNLKTAATTDPSADARDEAAAIEAARQAAIETARLNLLKEIQERKTLSVTSYLSADIYIPSARALDHINKNVQAIQAKTPDRQLTLEVIKTEVLKETVVDRLANQVTKNSVTPLQLVSAGLLEFSYPNKSSVMLEIKRHPSADLDSYERVQAVIAEQKAAIQARKDRLAKSSARVRALVASVGK